jgi:hypothetical protein
LKRKSEKEKHNNRRSTEIIQRFKRNPDRQGTNREPVIELTVKSKQRKTERKKRDKETKSETCDPINVELLI